MGGEIFCPDLQSQNKSYRVTSRNRTCMVKFFALTLSLRTKATKLQAEIERVYWIFLPWSEVSVLKKQKLQGYKPKSNVYTGYFRPGHEYVPLRTKATELQAEIERV